MSAVDALCLAWIVFAVVFIIWRTDQYLKPPRIGKRASFQMQVRDGKIHFTSAAARQQSPEKEPGT